MASRCKGSSKFPPQMPPPAATGFVCPPGEEHAEPGTSRTRAGTPQPLSPWGELSFAADRTQLYGSAPRDCYFAPSRGLEQPDSEGSGVLPCNPVRHRRLSNSPERGKTQPPRSLLTAALRQSPTLGGAASGRPVEWPEPNPAQAREGRAVLSQVGSPTQSRSPSQQRAELKRPASARGQANEMAALCGSVGAEACVPADASLLQRYRIDL